MIYSNDAQNTASHDKLHSIFHELCDVLHEHNVSDDTISSVCEFLDVSKERDLSLLDGISTLPLDITCYRQQSEIESAYRKEIQNANDAELTTRYLLAMYKLFGCTCHDLTPVSQYGYGRAFQSHWHQALLEMYPPQEANARYTAIFVNTIFKERIGWYENKNETAFFKEISEKSSAELLAAANNAFSQSPQTAAALCIFLLQQMPIPQNEHDIPQDAQKAVALLNTICQQAMDGKNDANDIIAIAAAEAAFFSPVFHQNLPQILKSHPLSFSMGRMLHISERAFDVVSAVSSYITKNYIFSILNYERGNRYPSLEHHLETIVAHYPVIIREITETTNDLADKTFLNSLLKRFNPDFAIDSNAIHQEAVKEMATNIASVFPYSAEVEDYLRGNISFEEVYPFLENQKMGIVPYSTKKSEYYQAYGKDIYMCRAYLVILLCSEYFRSNLEKLTGHDGGTMNQPEIEFLMPLKLPSATVFHALGKFQEQYYSWNSEAPRIGQSLSPYADILADADVSNEPIPVRQLYLLMLKANPAPYHDKIMPFANDSSKVIQVIVSEIMIQQKWIDDAVALLSSKKASVRDIAMKVIEELGTEGLTETLQKAYESEKSASIKQRIGKLLGIETAAKPKENDTAKEMEQLCSPAKTKKLDWLFTTAFSPVKRTDGTEAETNFLKGLMMCYTDGIQKINHLAEKFAAQLDANDLKRFSAEVYGKWMDLEAPAKTKWVLSFCAVYGGSEMIHTIKQCIKTWAENSRGSLACDGVYAITMNGSSEALMLVDHMSRKFKQRQVRDAADVALQNAAQHLGITQEELADRIVPDLGFDKKMCRVFDYGYRQFQVFLNSALELEILCGEKKIKTIPKPGANDDAEKASAAYEAFKDMKKQMKTVISTQKERLEYVLLCDRKWTCPQWKKLFVDNAVMHCFAIGLIWGIYEDGKPVTAFRYMDDGSFTTSDEEELELADNARIGLVHPIELSENECKLWQEQLSDYEITQPFQQLSRPIYRVKEEEKNFLSLNQYSGVKIINQVLVSKLQKFGWEKGAAQDAGCFYEFYHNDISECIKNEDGSFTYKGFITELQFSGTYIGSFMMDAEEVSIEEAYFYLPSQTKNTAIPLSEVPPRYFSEILFQLDSILGEK